MPLSVEAKSVFIAYEHSVQGSYPSNARRTTLENGLLSPRRLVDAVKHAEDAGLDLLLLGDDLNTRSASDGTPATSAEPITLAAYLAGKSRYIGIGITANPLLVQPYNLARLIASADHISYGRTVLSFVPAQHGNVLDNHLGNLASGQQDDPAEYLEILRKLWDSWEDGAFIRDKSSGDFVDPTKVHAVSHQGRTYSVHGALNVARSPQGRPPVISRWPSTMALPLDSEITLIDAATDDEYHRHLNTLQDAGVTTRPFSEIALLLADSDEQAWQQLLFIRHGLRNAAESLSHHVGVTVHDIPPEQPIPANRVRDFNGNGSLLWQRARWRLAEPGNEVTLDQLLEAWLVPGLLAVGSADSVAATLSRWHARTQSAGWLFRPLGAIEQLTRLSGDLLPRLGSTAVFARSPRERLGLARPASIYAAPDRLEAEHV